MLRAIAFGLVGCLIGAVIIRVARGGCQAVVTAAAQAFARNDIDRAEFMRRITPSLS
jgi:hypothetical protein